MAEADSDSKVISGVIDDVRQSFLDSGMDLETLAKLEKLWISKLYSKDDPDPVPEVEPGPINREDKSKKMKTEQDDVAKAEERDRSAYGGKGKKVKKKTPKLTNIEQIDGPAESSEEDDYGEDHDDDDEEVDLEESKEENPQAD